MWHLDLLSRGWDQAVQILPTHRLLRPLNRDGQEPLPRGCTQDSGSMGQWGPRVPTTIQGPMCNSEIPELVLGGVGPGRKAVSSQEWRAEATHRRLTPSEKTDPPTSDK